MSDSVSIWVDDIGWTVLEIWSAWLSIPLPVKSVQSLRSRDFRLDLGWVWRWFSHGGDGAFRRFVCQVLDEGFGEDDGKCNSRSPSGMTTNGKGYARQLQIRGPSLRSDDRFGTRAGC